MKKTLTLAFALLLAIAMFAGCSSNAPAATTAPVVTETPAPTVQPTEAPTPEPTVAPTEAAAPVETSAVNVNDIIASMGGTNAEVLASWPAGLPTVVPEFKYGTFNADVSFKMDVQGITAYAMSYKGVTQADIDQYNKALTDNGFTVNTQAVGEITTYSGVFMEKDGTMTMVVMMPIGQDIFMVEVIPSVKTPTPT